MMIIIYFVKVTEMRKLKENFHNRKMKSKLMMDTVLAFYLRFVTTHSRRAAIQNGRSFTRCVTLRTRTSL